MRRTLAGIFLLTSLALGQGKLEFAPFLKSNAVSYARLIALKNGARVFIGTLLQQSFYNESNYHMMLNISAIAAPDGSSISLPLSTSIGGNGDDVPVDAAVDASGNVWIVGNTDSDDFKLVNPIFSTKTPYRQSAFVMEFTPNMDTVLFATYLGGPAGTSAITSATAVAVDASGNVYVGGSTNDRTFPLTAAAFNATAPDGNNTFSYVVKISAAGKLVYSTILGTGNIDCVGGSGCIGRTSSASVGGLAADATGAVTIAETRSASAGYVSRLSPDGSKQLWKATIQSATQPYVTSLSMAQDASGNVSLFGVYGGQSGFAIGNIGNFGLFAAMLSADASKVIYNTDLGQSTDVVAQGVVLDSAGNAYLAGTSSSAQFPTVAGSPHLGSDFVLRLNAAGVVQKVFSFPRGVVTSQPRIDATDRLLLLGTTGAALTLPVSYNFDSPLVVGFANAASFQMNSGMSRGTLVSLFGYDLGSSQVTFDGATSPVIYNGATQINAIVPFASAIDVFSNVAMKVTQGSVTQASATFTASLPPQYSIGIFTTDGIHAAALNQDGTVNSAANPATAGSIVSIFGTGAVWPADLQTAGALATKAESLDQSQNNFEVSAGPSPTTFAYLGAAPGLYVGVFQMNAVVVKAGTQASFNIRQILNGTIAPNTEAVSAYSNSVAIYVK